MHQEKNEGIVKDHIIPLYVSYDSKEQYGIQSHSLCDKPCVCHCVCKHGKSSSLDVMSNSKAAKANREILYREFLLEQ